MDSLRKPSVSPSSHQHHKLKSRPILSDQNDKQSSSERKEVVLNIKEEGKDGEHRHGGKIWRESSYNFLRDAVQRTSAGFEFQDKDMEEDPPSKLIGQFLHKQKLSGDFSLDMDLKMEELGGSVKNSNLPPISESPNNSRVEIGSETVTRNSDLKSGEVLVCTGNGSFKKSKSFLRNKTSKSRLMDAPLEDKCERTVKSGNSRSGLLGKSMDEEEEDPFAEDLPDEFKKEKFSIWSVLQWVILILIVGVFVCSTVIPYFAKKRLWDIPLWKWEILLLVLVCGRLVSGWGTRVVVFLLERSFLLRKRVLYFVYGVRKAVQNCLWLCLVLLAWHFLFDKQVKKEVHRNKILDYVTNILVSMLATTLLWLVKTLLLKSLVSSFHVNTYFDRIQEALFNQYVIETLSGPPTVEIKNALEEEDEEVAEVQKLQNAGARMPADLKATIKSGRVVGRGGLQQRSPRDGKSYRISGAIFKQKDEGITIDKLHKMNQKNISAWNMKRMMNIVRHGVLSTLDERILSASDEDEAAGEIRSEFKAKCAARKIFNNVAKPGSKYIYLEDLMRFMKEDEALKTMSLFEGATESKRVKKSSLNNWVVNAFRERKALALTLDDTKTAVNQLHRMVIAVMVILIFVMWLLILGIAGTQLLLFISSQLLLFAFMFGNTFKMVFEAIIFLFAMHPFDVGDRCEIDDVQMVVEEMNILTTVFLRYDNQKITYPNSVLSTKPISNYYRSPDMGDAIDFCVHISTPVEKIALMKQRIIQYIENKTEHWAPAPMVVVRDVEDMNRLKLSVWPTHRMNHQDMGERWVRRALLVEEMIKIFRELDIEYRMLPVDVNVRNMPSLSSGRLPSNWTCSN